MQKWTKTEVKNGGAAGKSVKNTNLLVIIRARL